MLARRIHEQAPQSSYPVYPCRVCASVARGNRLAAWENFTPTETKKTVNPLNRIHPLTLVSSLIVGLALALYHANHLKHIKQRPERLEKKP